MIKETIKFKADTGQKLKRLSELRTFAIETINYINAQFDLPSEWHDFETLSAIWFTDKNQAETIIDESGLVTIPKEVLNEPGTLWVNLCGINRKNGKLWQRWTSYPEEVLGLKYTNIGTED